MARTRHSAASAWWRSTSPSSSRSPATFSLQGLPAVLAGYRERGILRRLNATPAGAGRLLGAQLTVNLAVAVASTAGVLVVGRLAFGVALPGQPAGFALAFVLTAAAMLSLGLLVASLARTAGWPPRRGRCCSSG